MTKTMMIEINNSSADVNREEVLMDTKSVITLARLHRDDDNSESARICLSDAVSLADAGKLDDARRRAVQSLRFSVGVFHPDFKRATR